MSFGFNPFTSKLDLTRTNGELDDTFVLKAGDTMTGTLGFSNALNGAGINSFLYPDNTGNGAINSADSTQIFTWNLGGGSDPADFTYAEGVDFTWMFNDIGALGLHGNNLVLDFGRASSLSPNTFRVTSKDFLGNTMTYNFGLQPGSMIFSADPTLSGGSRLFTIRNDNSATTAHLILNTAGGDIRLNPATGRFLTVNSVGTNDTDFRMLGGARHYGMYYDYGAYSNLGQWTFGSGRAAGIQNPTVTGAYFTIRNPVDSSDLTVTADYATFKVDNSQVSGTEVVKLGGAVTTIASVWLKEPNISLDGNTLTNTATFYIETVATEATNNYAVWVDTGTSRFDGDLTFATSDSTNIILGTTTGTKIGTADTQKLGFWNATPVVQPSAYTQTYATATKTHAALTSATLTDSTGGTANTTLVAITGTGDDANVNNNFADLIAQVNALRVDLENAKQVLNAVIDDDQTIGIKA